MAPSTPISHSQIPGARKKRWASHVRGTNRPHHVQDSVTPEATPQTSTLDHATASPNLGTGPSQNAKTCKFLNLPTELLHTIASELCGTQAILSLARVNKHINGITQQALFQNLIIPKNHVKQVLEVLVQKRIKTVSSVDFGDYECCHRFKCSCPSRQIFNEPEAMKAYIACITARSRDFAKSWPSWPTIRQQKPKGQLLFLNLLLLLYPNIRSITLEAREAWNLEAARPPASASLPSTTLPARNTDWEPSSPFEGPALQEMQEKLEELAIAEDSRWKGPARLETLRSHRDLTWRNYGRQSITFGGFVKLKRLDVPMDVLGEAETIVFLHPKNLAATKSKGEGEDVLESDDKRTVLYKIIPLTLKYLHLRSCNQHTFALLQKLNKVPVEQLQLRHIELFMKTCPRTLIIQCYSADEGRLNYPRILKELVQKGIKISFYTGLNETFFDMRKELAALTLLSPLEAWKFALLDRQFSELDTQASMNRRLSVYGRGLFLKHAQDYFLLFNSPTFNPDMWMSVAFFHGIRHTKWDTEAPPRKKKVKTLDLTLWSNRPLGMRAQKRRLPRLLGLSHFHFSFSNKKKSPSVPQPIQFLGANFMIPGQLRPAARATRRGTRVPGPKPDVKEDPATTTTTSKQSHWLDRILTRGQETGLEHAMAALRLDDCDNTTPRPHIISFDNGSHFNGAQWADVDWENALQIFVAN